MYTLYVVAYIGLVIATNDCYPPVGSECVAQKEVIKAADVLHKCTDWYCLWWIWLLIVLAILLLIGCCYCCWAWVLPWCRRRCEKKEEPKPQPVVIVP